MSRGALFSVGLLVNLLVLGLPLLFKSGPSVDPSLLWFFALASGFFAVDFAAPTGAGDMVVCKRTERMGMLTGATMLAMFWIGLFEHGPRSSGWLVTFGAALMASGILLRLIAILTLRRSFVSELAPAQLLVQHGVYSLVRHPSELANLAILGGACVLLSSMWAGVVWIALLLPLVLWRARSEDRMLDRSFGAEFRRYRSRVGGLWPARG